MSFKHFLRPCKIFTIHLISYTGLKLYSVKNKVIVVVWLVNLTYGLHLYVEFIEKVTVPFVSSVDLLLSQLRPF